LKHEYQKEKISLDTTIDSSASNGLTPSPDLRDVRLLSLNIYNTTRHKEPSTK